MIFTKEKYDKIINYFKDLTASKIDQNKPGLAEYHNPKRPVCFFCHLAIALDAKCKDEPGVIYSYQYSFYENDLHSLRNYISDKMKEFLIKDQKSCPTSTFPDCSVVINEKGKTVIIEDIYEKQAKKLGGYHNFIKIFLPEVGQEIGIKQRRD